jgi:hypothetical protein
VLAATVLMKCVEKLTIVYAGLLVDEPVSGVFAALRQV